MWARKLRNSFVPSGSRPGLKFKLERNGQLTSTEWPEAPTGLAGYGYQADDKSRRLTPRRSVLLQTRRKNFPSRTKAKKDRAPARRHRGWEAVNIIHDSDRLNRVVNEIWGNLPLCQDHSPGRVSVAINGQRRARTMVQEIMAAGVGLFFSSLNPDNSFRIACRILLLSSQAGFADETYHRFTRIALAD